MRLDLSRRLDQARYRIARVLIVHVRKSARSAVRRQLRQSLVRDDRPGDLEQFVSGQPDLIIRL